MPEVGLVVDEVADLPQEIIEKHKIEIVTYIVDWPEGENLPGGNIFQKMREAEKRGIKTLINTSQASPKVFLDKYQSQLQKFNKVLCITISSKLSGGYNSAMQAKSFLKPEEQEKVFVVDSFNASAGQGLLVLRAADLINKKEKEIEEIVKELEKLVPQVHLIGMLEDPKWLEYSGRLPHILANWIRKMVKFGVRPLVGVKKGIVTAVGIKTKVKDVPSALFSELEAKTRKIRGPGGKIQIAITHAGNLDGAQKLKEMIGKELKEAEIIFLSLVDIVVGARVGPGTLICAWVEA